MKWRVVARPQAKDDVLEAADWYDAQRAGLGDAFIEEVLAVFGALEANPLIGCRRHPTKNIRWRYPKRFPYRVIYEVIERGERRSDRGCDSRRSARLSLEDSVLIFLRLLTNN